MKETIIAKENAQKELLSRLLKGEVTLENPYAKPLLELWDAIAFLEKNKQKVPTLLKELAEEVHKTNMSYKPF